MGFHMPMHIPVPVAGMHLYSAPDGPGELQRQVVYVAEAMDVQGALQRRRAGRQLPGSAQREPKEPLRLLRPIRGPPRGKVRAQALRDRRCDLLHSPQRWRFRAVGRVQTLRRIVTRLCWSEIAPA